MRLLLALTAACMVSLANAQTCEFLTMPAPNATELLDFVNAEYTFCKKCALGAELPVSPPYPANTTDSCATNHFGNGTWPGSVFAFNNEAALCDSCALPVFTRFLPCDSSTTYSPWFRSIARDKEKYCGSSSSSGSLISSSSGLQSSFFSEGSPSSPSGSWKAFWLDGPSNSRFLNDWQIVIIVIVVVVAICACCACIGGGYFAHRKGLFKKKAPAYDADDDRDYYDDAEGGGDYSPYEGGSGEYPAGESVPFSDPAAYQ